MGKDRLRIKGALARPLCTLSVTQEITSLPEGGGSGI